MYRHAGHQGRAAWNPAPWPSAAGAPAGPEPGLPVLPAGQPVRGPLAAPLSLPARAALCPDPVLQTPELHVPMLRDSHVTQQGTRTYTEDDTGPLRVQCGADRKEESPEFPRSSEVGSPRLAPLAGLEL